MNFNDWLNQKIDKKNSFICQNNRSITKQSWSEQTRINYNEKILIIIDFLLIKSMNQCMKCMKFEHVMIYCKQSYYNCKWCDKNYENRQHLCFTCKSFESCSYDSSKCINCSQLHAANNKACENFKILFIKSRENYKNKLWLKN